MAKRKARKTHKTTKKVARKRRTTPKLSHLAVLDYKRKKEALKKATYAGKEVHVVVGKRAALHKALGV